MRIAEDRILVGLNEFKRCVETALDKDDLVLLSLDLETTGLVYHQSKIAWVSWCIDDLYGCVPLRHRNFGDVNSSVKNDETDDVSSFVKELHQNRRIHIIYHNAKFDLAMLIGNRWLTVDNIIPNRIQDTLILSFLQNPIKTREFGGGSHSLKHLYKEHLQEPGEEDQPEYEEIAGACAFEDSDISKAKFYATFDAYSTYQLFKQVFKPALDNDKALNHYYCKIERPHIITTIEIIMMGMRLLPQSTALAAGSPTAMSNLEQAFQYAKEQLFALARRTFRFASPDDFRSVMFGRLTEIKTKKRGKAQGKPLIDKDTLIEIFAQSKNLYQKAITAIAIYAKHLDITIRKHNEMYEALNPVTGRVHANIRVTTSSGRFSSPSPNILSLGKSSKIKEHIVPQGGWGFVVADFSQIDLRAIANETGMIKPNSKMLADVNAGKDLHFNTLGIIDDQAREKIKLGWNRLAKDGTSVTLLNNLTIPLTGDDEKLAQCLVKDRSNLAKKINFGVSYGLGAKNLFATLMKHDKALDEIVEFPQNHLRLPDWVSALSEKALQADYRQKTWIDRAATILGQYQDLESWIRKVEDKIIIKELDIDTVEGYLDKFYQEYQEIKEFQIEVEKDLTASGKTYNIFGRLCRAEFYAHMLDQTEENNSKVALDLRLPNREWYRLFITTTKVDRKGIECKVETAFRLFMKETTKINTKPIDLRIHSAQLIYHVKPESWSNFESIRVLANDQDTYKILLNDVHADADWDAEGLFEHLKPAASDFDPSYPPAYPFCRIPHGLIQRVVLYKDDVSGPNSRKDDPALSYVGFDKLRRNLISARVSSTSMDIAKIAMIEFRRRVASDPRWKNYDDRPKIVNCVHDEIVVECRDEDINDVQKILNSCMKRLNGRSVDGAPSHFDVYVFGDRNLLVDIDAESGKSLVNYAEAKP